MQAVCKYCMFKSASKLEIFKSFKHVQKNNAESFPFSQFIHKASCKSYIILITLSWLAASSRYACHWPAKAAYGIMVQYTQFTKILIMARKRRRSETGLQFHKRYLLIELLSDTFIYFCAQYKYNSCRTIY